jgi:hypothetical protein
MTSLSTQGLFGTDEDSYADVNDWQDVEFEKFFAWAGARNVNAASPFGIQGGFATRLCPVYLGLYYNGTIWDGNSGKYTDEDGKRDDSHSYLTTEDGMGLTDRFDVIVGVPLIGGIKARVDLNLKRDEDVVDSTKTTTTTVNTNRDKVILDLTWGKNFNLGGGLLKPEVELLYNWDFSGPKIEGPDGTAHDRDLPGVTPANIGSTSASIFDLGDLSVLSIGAKADYEFASDGSSQAVLSAGYTLGVGIFKDPGYDNTTPASNKESWTGSYFKHEINAGYKKTFDINESLSAGWGAGADATIQSLDASYKLGGTAQDSPTALEIEIKPVVAAGFVYNFGGKAQAFRHCVTIT